MILSTYATGTLTPLGGANQLLTVQSTEGVVRIYSSNSLSAGFIDLFESEIKILATGANGLFAITSPRYSSSEPASVVFTNLITGSGSGTGTGGLNLPFVDTVANLPTTGNTIDDLIYVRVETGVRFINFKPTGIYRWTGSAWVHSGINAQIISENTSSFVELIQSEYTTDYVYYQLNTGTEWQINRYTTTDNPVKTVATLANNPAVLHASNAWANRTLLTYV